MSICFLFKASDSKQPFEMGFLRQGYHRTKDSHFFQFLEQILFCFLVHNYRQGLIFWGQKHVPDFLERDKRWKDSRPFQQLF